MSFKLIYNHINRISIRNTKYKLNASDKSIDQIINIYIVTIIPDKHLFLYGHLDLFTLEFYFKLVQLDKHSHLHFTIK